MHYAFQQALLRAPTPERFGAGARSYAKAMLAYAASLIPCLPALLCRSFAKAMQTGGRLCAHRE